MPIDDRIRDGLARNAEVPFPTVERHLGRVQVRRRRRLQARVAALAASAVAIVALVPWALVAGLAQRGADPAPSPGSGLPGTYRVVVGDAGSSAGVGGTWTVTLGEGGAVVLDPPPGYEGPVGVGESYELSGPAEMTTNLFVGSPGCQRADPPVGVYGFVVADSELRFNRVEDTCPARARLLGEPWERLP